MKIHSAKQPIICNVLLSQRFYFYSRIFIICCVISLVVENVRLRIVTC
jgi:hypothetical protein